MGAWERTDNDRMVQVAGPSVLVAYEYDAEGIRVKTEDGAGAVNYLVDKQLPYGQVIAEYKNDGSLTAGYVYGLERISQSRGGVGSYYLADGQGSIRQLVDAAGNVTDRYWYTAFGEELAKIGSTVNEFRYTGESWDPNSKFYYLRARTYDPSNGRLASVDPFVGDPQVAVSLHRYLYANASPVSFSDPSGNFAGTLGGLMGGMAGGAIMQTIWATATLMSAALVHDWLNDQGREKPVRLYHYTKWESVYMYIANPFCKTGGINSPSGLNFFTDDLYLSGEEALRKLALPNKPDVAINLSIYPRTDGLNGPSKVGRKYGQPGEGQEYWTSQSVPFWRRLPVVFPLF